LKTAFLVGNISYLEIVQAQVPFTFIGSILGTTQLGLFSRAYSLVQLPIELLTNAISRVLYSSFVTLRDDKERFVKGLYRLMECATVVIFPIAIGMAVAAPQLVGAVLGPRWLETQPLIPWLTLGSALTMTGTLFAGVIEAALHLRVKFYGQLVTLLVGIVAFALLTRHGLVDASIAFAIAWFLYFLGQVYLAKVLLHLNALDLLVCMAPGLVGGAVVGIYIFSVQMFLSGVATVSLLIVEVIGSGLLLAGVVAFLFPRLFRELLNYSGLDRYLPF
jgi:lipopolysaccharide exporter